MILVGVLTLLLSPVAGGETETDKGTPPYALGSEGATPIEYGECISGRLGVGQIQEYTFEGMTGDMIVIQMGVEHSISTYPDPALELLGPGGELLDSNYSYETDTWIYREVNRDGTYTIRAMDRGGNNGGPYGLSLQLVNRLIPGTEAIERGHYDYAHIGIACRKAYQFSATRGALASIRMSVAHDISTYPDPCIQLFRPDGSKFDQVWSSGIEARMDTVLDVTGLWTVLAADAGSNNGGWYGISITWSPCDTAYIVCPDAPIQVNDSMAGGEVCVPLLIGCAETVTVDGATWTNNELCFDAPSEGVYDFTVYAENGTTADTCDVAVMVGDTLPPVCVLPLEHEVEVCALGYVVGVPIQINGASTVSVSNNASWLNDTLYFVATRAGTHYFTITASNQYGTTVEEAVVEVEWRPEIDFDVDVLTFWTNTGDIELPGQQVIHVSSPTCEDSLVEWQLTVEGGEGWLQVDKESGTAPDSVIATITKPGIDFAPGVYSARLVFEAGSYSEVPVVLNVVLFVESGIDIGEDRVNPGDTGLVPIVLYSEDTLTGFTLPLHYEVQDPGEVWLDSIIVNPSLVPYIGAYEIDSLLGDALLQVVQDPPLPPDTPLTVPPDTSIIVGWLRFGTSANAALGDIPIDTTTYSLGGVDYQYQFQRADGTNYTPSFNAGKLVIGRASNIDAGDEPYCYPNPFNPEREPTHLCFFPDGTASVAVKIFDTGGNLVRTAAEDEMAVPDGNGVAELTWNGKNGDGEYVANGVYFFVVEASGGGRWVGKIAVLR